MPDYSLHHRQIGSIGGLRRAARQTNEDGRKAAAQAARMARYDAMVPADVTDPVERARRRQLLLRADMQALARRSALARSKTTTPARTPATSPEPGPVASTSPVRAQTTRNLPRVRPNARLDTATPTDTTAVSEAPTGASGPVGAGADPTPPRRVGVPQPVRAAGTPTRPELPG